MYTIFFNYWRRAAFFFLLALLLYTYLGLPESVAIKHNEIGRPIGFISKQKFFYISVVVIVLLNLVFGLVKTQISKIDFEKRFSNNKTMGNLYLKGILSGWLNAILAFIFTYLIFVLFSLQTINRDISQNLDRDYSWILIIGAVLFLIILFSVPLKLLVGKTSKT